MLLWRIAQQLSRLGMPAACVARLNHEVADDSVEKHPIVISLTYLFQEIVTMKWCLVIEFYADIATIGLEQHLHAFLSLLCPHGEGTREEKHHE